MTKPNAFDWQNWECPITGRIKWSNQQKEKQNGLTVTKHIEQARLKDPNHDAKIGLLLNQHERLLPKKFHIYSRAGAPK